MTLAVIGAATPERLARAIAVFESAGFQRVDRMERGDSDSVFAIGMTGAEALRDADARGIQYVLVHDGPDTGEVGGTFERAHHRVEGAQLAELAEHLRTRVHPLVTCLAFAFKNGVPLNPALLVDVRFLDNPYWVPGLRDLDGTDDRVAAHVMGQEAARRLLDRIEVLARELIPLYHAKGRMNLTIAFGCTGGRHRSVALASALAGRLADLHDVDVQARFRDLQPAS